MLAPRTLRFVQAAAGFSLAVGVAGLVLSPLTLRSGPSTGDLATEVLRSGSADRVLFGTAGFGVIRPARGTTAASAIAARAIANAGGGHRAGASALVAKATGDAAATGGWLGLMPAAVDRLESDRIMGRAHLLTLPVRLALRRLLGLSLVVPMEKGGLVELHHHLASVELLSKRESPKLHALDLLMPPAELLFLVRLLLILVEPRAVLPLWRLTARFSVSWSQRVLLEASEAQGGFLAFCRTALTASLLTVQGP